MADGDAQQLSNPRDFNQTFKDKGIKKISWSSLSRLNIKFWNLEVENYRKFNTFALIKQRENLNYEYQQTLTECEYDFAEHMHNCNEVRYILSGELFYDVYDNNKQLIRIHLMPGDLLSIPQYHFHRSILPQNVSSVTFVQLTRNAIPDGNVADASSSNNNNNSNNDDDEEHKQKECLPMQTYFMRDVQANPKQFLRLMMQSTNMSTAKSSVNTEYMESSPSVNGIGFVMGGRAKALASYPHLREFNGQLFVSGTSSRRPDNTHIGATRLNDGSWHLDIRKQTRAVLENIRVILGTAGAGLQHLLAVTVFLVKFDDYQGMNEVYDEYFDGETGPTRTTVAVARLPHPNLLIEIQCTAAKPN